MYMHIKKRLTLPVFSILLLLTLMYSSISYASRYSRVIEDKTLSDTKITFSNIDPSDLVIAHIFITNDKGKRVYLRTIQITLTDPLILPLGFGAELHWNSEKTIINEPAVIQIQEYTTPPIVTRSITTQNAEAFRRSRIGIIRMMRTDDIDNPDFEFHRSLLRNIAELELIPIITATDYTRGNGSTITLRPLTDFAPTPSNHRSAFRMQQNGERDDWDYTGNYAYIMPVGERDPSILIPPYTMINVYFLDPEQPDTPLPLLGRFILAPGEILPRFLVYM